MVKFSITEEMNQRQAFEVLTKLVILLSTAFAFVLAHFGQTAISVILAFVAVFFTFTAVDEEVKDESKHSSLTMANHLSHVRNRVCQ